MTVCASRAVSSLGRRPSRRCWFRWPLTFVLFAEPVVDLLYGDDYARAVAPLRYLGAMVVFLGINNLAAVLVIARERPLAFARVVAVVLGANIALNAVLIPPYGASGAAFTAAFSAFVLFVAGFLLVRSLIGRVRLARALVGPAIGVLGGVAYVLGFLAYERLRNPRDLDTYRGLAARNGTVR